MMQIELIEVKKYSKSIYNILNSKEKNHSITTWFRHQRMVCYEYDKRLLQTANLVVTHKRGMIKFSMFR